MALLQMVSYAEQEPWVPSAYRAGPPPWPRGSPWGRWSGARPNTRWPDGAVEGSSQLCGLDFQGVGPDLSPKGDLRYTKVSAYETVQLLRRRGIPTEHLQIA